MVRHNPTAPNRNEAIRSAAGIAKRKRTRDQDAMRRFAAQELAAQDAVVLQRLQDHLTEMHAPLGYTSGIQGAAWTDLARLEAAHLKLHETWKGHSH